MSLFFFPTVIFAQESVGPIGPTTTPALKPPDEDKPVEKPAVVDVPYKPQISKPVQPIEDQKKDIVKKEDKPEEPKYMPYILSKSVEPQGASDPVFTYP